MRSLGLLSFSFSFLFSILASLLLSPATCLSILPNDAFALFIFGDGQSDAGNNAYRDPSSRFNGFPYGLSLANISTGRPSDGYLIVDFIAAKSGLPPIKPYLERATKDWHYGVNFAIVGASIFSNDTDLAFSNQLDQFEDVVNYLKKTYGDTQTQRLLSNSVYLITVSTDDFLNIDPNGAYDIDLVSGNYTAAISRIYELGGRKFGFQNIGPLEKLPYPKFLWSGTETIVKIQVGAIFTNLAVNSTLFEIAKNTSSFEGFKYAYFDYFSFVTNHTSSFNATAACCGSESYNGRLTCGIEGAFELCFDPNDHLWFDGAYTTQAANKKIADEFWSGNKNVVGPYNLQELFQDNDSTKFAAI